MSKREEENKKKKKAVAAFKELHNGLKETCGKIEQISEWKELIKKINPLLDEFVKVIPIGYLQRIRKAYEIFDETHANLQEICERTSGELETLIEKLQEDIEKYEESRKEEPSKKGINWKLIAPIIGVVIITLSLAIPNFTSDVEPPDFEPSPPTPPPPAPTPPVTKVLEISDMIPEEEEVFTALPVFLMALIRENPPLQDATVEFFVDGKSAGITETNSEGLASITLGNIPAGQHLWKVNVKKENYRSAQSNEKLFYLDLSLPHLEINTPNEETHTAIKRVRISGTATDDSGFDEIGLTIDGDPIEGAPALTGVWGTEIELEEGRHLLSLYATDLAGKSQRTSVSFTVDFTPPKVTGVYDVKPNENGWHNSPFKILWRGTDNLSNVSCDRPTEVNLLQGEGRRFTGSCSDEAGNRGEGFVFVNYDSEDPIAQITKTVDGFGYDFSTGLVTYSSKVTISFSGEDKTSGINHFRCSLDGGPTSLCKSPITYDDFTLGSHSFRVEAVDYGGNISKPRTFDWKSETVK